MSLTKQDIINAGGKVVNNSDGTISVYMINSATGQLAPIPQTLTSCQALGGGAFFDTTTQECKWSNIVCEANAPINVVLNPKGNDGAIFSITPDEICGLNVDFDYLFKFDCDTLTTFATSSPSSILNIFETIGASMVLNVINIKTGISSEFYRQQFFTPIGKGNFYNHLSNSSTNTGFFICGELVKTLTDTTCYPLNLYDLSFNGDTVNCSIPAKQILQELYTESGLPASSTSTFKENINTNAFGPNWQHFTTTITDQTIINSILNQKIKLTIELSGLSVNTCLLIDNISLSKNCTKVTSNDLFLSKSPGFVLDKIIDNKKSWVVNTAQTNRIFDVTNYDGTQPIRDTNYTLADERLVVNTKEIDLDIDIASAVEADVWSFVSNNECILSGLTINSGDTSTRYCDFGTDFFPAIDLTKIPYEYDLSGNLLDKNGNIVTPLNINNSNNFWSSESITTYGRLNNVGLKGLDSDKFSFAGVVGSVNIQTSGTHYIGFGSDNFCEIYLNDVLIFNFINTSQYNFRNWTVFPIYLNFGINKIRINALNYGPHSSSNTSAFGLEIYEPLSYSTLTGATSISQANPIFSTIHFIGTPWSNATATTYKTAGILSNGLIVCEQVPYCGSATFGDANLNIANIFTQPMSGITTFEDFRYYITSELIDVKDRQTISSYPTLRALYDRYLRSTNYCNSTNAGSSYFTMDQFSSLVGNYWVDLIEQLIPATTIWGATKIYTNTAFDEQKYKYKSYSTLFANNTTDIITTKVLSPVSGYTCTTSATTSFIVGDSTDTLSLFNQSDVNDYPIVYAIQMNSGSEFIGVVNVIGSNGGNSNAVLNECLMTVSVIIDGGDNATAIPSLGTPPYTYLWSNGVTAQRVIGLSNGTYSVTVTDSANCIIKSDVIINTSTCTLAVAMSETPTLGGLHNGTATATPSLGTAPYTYLWSNGATTQTITGLLTGSYSVTVTDASGCIISESISVTNTPCTLTVAMSSTPSVGGLHNGTATATPSLGIPPYIYLWNDGQITQTAIGLSDGVHTVTVTDLNNCVQTGTVTVANTPCTLTVETMVTGSTSININTYTPIVISYSNGPCGDDATSYQNYERYQITFSSIPTVDVRVQATYYLGATLKTFDYTLPANTYNIVNIYEGTCGCDTSSFGVNCPTSLTVTVTAFGGVYIIPQYPLTNPSFSLNNGSAKAIATGVAPYSYSWNTIPVLETQEITGLSEGTYTVTVIDADNCTQTATAVINNI